MNRIYRFSQTHCDWTGTDELARSILGGKGAGLVRMCRAELPVPPGFTITTKVCNEYLALAQDKREAFLDELMVEVFDHMEWLKDQFGFMPLVSVRSGAPLSMPGMMDTILNVGLGEHNLPDWSDRIGVRSAYDSMRRLIQMLGSTACGVPHEVFEFQLAKMKKLEGVTADTELDSDAMAAVCGMYEKAFRENRGYDFPHDPKVQLRAAVAAVFNSWMNDRAIEYRKLNGIDEAMGTAVNVQAMVFGNMGDDSGTGVLFTRDPSTGCEATMGEFLQNAQGEDVVAGIRTPLPIEKMGELGSGWQSIRHQIEEVCVRLEEMYRDMVDVEFTIQQGKLWLLQSRVGKRSARAAFRIAVDLFKEGVIDADTALKRLTREQFKIVRRPSIDPSFKTPPVWTGIPACPGVVSGKPVFSAEDAINCAEPCILITKETTPDDIAGMNAAVGILTKTGGATSHAAVVARAMDKACVVGCTDLDLDANWTDIVRVTIDGATGGVWVNIDVPVIDSSDAEELATVKEWALQKLGAIEAAPVDLGPDVAHCVMAAQWWGNEEVMTAVLDSICELPSRDHVYLDLRSPMQRTPASDAELIEIFGSDERGKEKAFAAALKMALIDRAGALKGVKLVNAYQGFADLMKVGFELVGEPMGIFAPQAMPADYAIFSALGR